MSEQWQIRRGTTAENDNFTGAEGEITMDTDKKQLRVHDGQTQGGKTIPDLGMIFAAIFPDYTRKVTMSTPFTAPTYGFAMWNNGGTSACTVNGQTIAVAGNDSYNEGPTFVMLKPGDVMTFGADTGLAEFYPCSGA